jgi:hypothetical protein
MHPILGQGGLRKGPGAYAMSHILLVLKARDQVGTLRKARQCSLASVIRYCTCNSADHGIVLSHRQP